MPSKTRRQQTSYCASSASMPPTSSRNTPRLSTESTSCRRNRAACTDFRIHRTTIHLGHHYNSRQHHHKYCYTRRHNNSCRQTPFPEASSPQSQRLSPPIKSTTNYRHCSSSANVHWFLKMNISRRLLYLLQKEQVYKSFDIIWRVCRNSSYKQSKRRACFF